MTIARRRLGRVLRDSARSRGGVFAFAVPAIALTACAAPANLGGQSLNASQGRSRVAITRDGVWGPGITVRRADDDPHMFLGFVSSRGSSSAAEIEMRVVRDEIRGYHGGMPIKISIARKGDAVFASGNYGAQPVSLALLRGPSGGCAFTPAREGVPSCGSVKSDGLARVLDVPPVASALPDAEQAALVVAALYD